MTKRNLATRCLWWRPGSGAPLDFLQPVSDPASRPGEPNPATADATDGEDQSSSDLHQPLGVRGSVATDGTR